MVPIEEVVASLNRAEQRTAQPEPEGLTEVTHEQLLRLKEVFGDPDSITRPWQVCMSLNRQYSSIQIVCSDLDQQDFDYLAQPDQPDQPEPEPPEPGDGEIDEEVATLIPWLLEEAAHAADADQSYAAGKLTLAAQLLGERRPATQPEPEALTVQECNDMRKHRENYIYECSDGDIQLDGVFSREDLLELARTIPVNQQPPES
jgi:hypothetical protein